MCGNFDVHFAPRTVTLLVRRSITKTVHPAQVVDYLLIDAVKIFNFARAVIKAAAFESQQPKRLARALVSPTRLIATVRVSIFSVEIDRDDQSIVLANQFEEI